MALTPFTRSLINRSIAEAQAAFARFGVALPPFAHWTPAEWERQGHDCDELRVCMLGWDVTDFGSGDFTRIGRTLFTVRNGAPRDPRFPKAYAQKYLYDPESQRAPPHFHRRKREDICCLAGGNIMVQLWTASAADQRSDAPVAVSVDGIARTVAAGALIRLAPGQSIHIPPRTVHQFWGEEGTGLTVSTEVSSVSDDWTDNVFLVDYGVRFPTIVEDEPRRHYLCHEYPAAVP